MLRRVEQPTHRRDYEIKLEGVEFTDFSLSLLARAAEFLLDGCQRAVRLAAEGRSLARGTPPQWLAPASEIRVHGMRPGSLELVTSAKPIHQVAPELFTQGSLFSPVHEETAMDLLLAAIQDAKDGKRDSDRLDADMLKCIAGVNELFVRGATAFRVRAKGAPAVVIDSAVAQGFRRMAEETPSPKMTRVSGTLDTVTASTKVFVLRIDATKSLRGIATGIPLQHLREHLGKAVVVEGTAYFHPSGNPLRIEADFIAASKESDSVWAALPRSIGDLARSVPPAVTLSSVFGQWPGEEGDDEVYALLERLS